MDENREQWTNTYDWSASGNDWSDAWGEVGAQWFSTIYPRVRHYLNVDSILEIAPGYGRWTEYLLQTCNRYIGVDVTSHCIDACRQRFSDIPWAEFYVNDGRSLSIVPDHSVDFCFSFDSLVHVEPEVVGAYLGELSTKLTTDGIAFLHHSNLGEYQEQISAGSLTNTGWRDEGMTADLFVSLSRDAGLTCPGQEVVNWISPALTDCLSLATRPGSKWDRPHVLVRNEDFYAEARSTSCLAQIFRSPAENEHLT